MMCSKCGEEKWKHDNEVVVAKSDKYPIVLKVELLRLECENCGYVWYSADLMEDSMFPEEVSR